LDSSVRPCGRARGVAGVGVVYQKSRDSEVVNDNHQKSGAREQSLKKRGYDFAARRAKEHAARRKSSAEEERYGSSNTNNQILFGNA
jgi:hypothetical protein